MPWSEAPLRTLTLPQDAGSTTPRVVIGPDVPAELVAFYGPGTSSGGIVAAIVGYTVDPSFPSIVQYTYEGWINDVQPKRVFGFVYDGDVYEHVRDRLAGGGWTETVYGHDSGGSLNPNLVQQDVSFQGQSGAVRINCGDGLLIATDMVGVSEDAVNAAAATDSTTSASYVSWAGGAGVASFTFIKRFNATRVRIDLSKTMDSSAAATTLQLGARIDTTDYDVTTPIQESAAAVRHCWSAHRYVSGIAAGTYTVTGRWKRTAGAGTLRTFAGGDHNSIAVRECCPTPS